MARSMDNTPDSSAGKAAPAKKKKSTKEKTKERRAEMAGRICGNCKHSHGDHAAMGGRSADSVWCYGCLDICPKVGAFLNG